MDKFPEVFERFEKRVDVDKIRSFDHLLFSFSWWAGKHWKGTKKQIEALKVEKRKIGIPASPERLYRSTIPSHTWRFEWVTVKSRP